MTGAEDPGGGSSWTTVWFKASTEQSQQEWLAASETVTAESSSMLVRFVFDSVDGVDNDQVGFLVDDVTVE